MDWDSARRQELVSRRGAQPVREELGPEWKWIEIRLPGFCIFCRLRPGKKKVAWNPLTRKLMCGRCAVQRKARVAS